jgi:hypothetical protein
MPNTSTCPKCDEPVALIDAPEASLVECPHCQEQFELAEALDFVAESDEEDSPPELLLVELRETEELPEESEEALTEEALDDEESWGELSDEELTEGGQEEEGEPEEKPEEPVQVRCPCCLDSFALEDLLLAETNEPICSEAASAILSDGSVRETDGIQFRFGSGSDSDDDHSGFRLASVEERPSASAGAFEFAAAVGTGADGPASQEELRARRRRRERGGVKDMLGAIFGGAAGLLITYYLLNLIGGPRFDMLKVYLPFVKHTAVHRPDWLGGPPEEEEFDSGLGDAIGAEGKTPEAAPKKPKAKDKEEVEPEVVADSAEMPAADEPASEEALPDDYVGLIAPPQVSSEDLGKALREVDRLAKAGPLGEEGYEAWCRVAEAATFIDRNDGEPQTQSRLDVTRGLLKELTAADVTKIGQFATRRRVNPDRANHGILLAGTARKPNTEKGKGYLTGLVMAGTGAQVVIASDHKLPIQEDDRVLLLGYLVDQPKEATQGLDTELPQITWVQTVVKFEQ